MHWDLKQPNLNANQCLIEAADETHSMAYKSLRRLALLSGVLGWLSIIHAI